MQMPAEAKCSASVDACTRAQWKKDRNLTFVNMNVCTKFHSSLSLFHLKITDVKLTTNKGIAKVSTVHAVEPVNFDLPGISQDFWGP